MLDQRGEGIASRPRLRPGASAKAIEARWKALGVDAETRAALFDADDLDHVAHHSAAIEGFIGTAKVPVGVAGPLRVRGLFAHGEYYVPLATTEAALVASYDRGAAIVTAAGGCAAMVLNESVLRTPGFVFASLTDAGRFVVWAIERFDEFRAVAATTTEHGELIDLRVTIDGRWVYIAFEFRTGDASGQNMVTFATQAICKWIASHAPIKPTTMFVEANMSGDKKACAQSFLLTRGRKVTAEAIVPKELVERSLRTTPARMAEYWRMSAVGGILSGCLGIQGHFANGLAALFIACGQDAACVAESAVGTTRMEVDASGGLYVSVTLPNLMVGTVGGGTGLPSADACLAILGLRGTGQARALAEVCTALILAGEISIVGALASDEFAQAHQRRARDRRVRSKDDLRTKRS